MRKCSEAMSSPRSQHRRIRGSVETRPSRHRVHRYRKLWLEGHNKAAVFYRFCMLPLPISPVLRRSWGAPRLRRPGAVAALDLAWHVRGSIPANKSLCKRQIRCSLVVGVRDRPRRPNIQASCQQQVVGTPESASSTATQIRGGTTPLGERR